MKLNLSTLKRIVTLPVKKLSFFIKENSHNNIFETYQYFINPHPKYKLIGNKTIGVMLIDFDNFKTEESYLKSINGKNSALYYYRKSIKRGYRFVCIDKNNFIDDIHEINTSSESRQGKVMAESYLVKTMDFENLPHYKYFGVLDENGKLVSYCDIGFYGDFCLVNRLLGHKNFLNDGIMYFMLVSLFKKVYSEKTNSGIRCIVYDMYFGATKGLKLFKEKIGFSPHRVKWHLRKIADK